MKSFTILIQVKEDFEKSDSSVEYWLTLPGLNVLKWIAIEKN